MKRLSDLQLQYPIAEGGEGIIYLKNKQIIKIYKHHIDKKRKELKIKDLITMHFPKSVAGPLEIVVDDNQQFVGYIMPHIEGDEIKRLSYKRFVQIRNIDLRAILRMLLQIKETLKALHQNNVYIGDLNDSNLLFDDQYNVYFIDVDSWSVAGHPCDVCMASFRDPLLQGNQFSAETDDYAFAILAFKAMTRLHPFGGKITPDSDLLTRMQRGLSVLGNHGVQIPLNVSPHTFMSPTLQKELKSIFEERKRFLLDQSLYEFAHQLTYCETHQDYYFKKFSVCPLCHRDAKLQVSPEKVVASTADIPCIRLVGVPDAVMLWDDHYLSAAGEMVHLKSQRKVPYQRGQRVYFSVDGSVVYRASDQQLTIQTAAGEHHFEKKYKSAIQVRDHHVYYISKSHELMELHITPQGNAKRKLSNVGINSYFHVAGPQQSFIYNLYDNMKLMQINGFNYMEERKGTSTLENVAAFHDEVTNRWCCIETWDDSHQITTIFEENQFIYRNDLIQYEKTLRNLCYHNNIIYKATAGMIRAFQYETNTYKDFPCSMVDEDSRLLKVGQRFKIINKNEIFEYSP